MTPAYADVDPPRSDIDAITEPTLLEFGSNTCGICRVATPHVTAALAVHPSVKHIRIEDGRGRKLGRSFGVKLWPTLVFLEHGKEVARLVRPYDAGSISEALAGIDASSDTA